MHKKKPDDGSIFIKGRIQRWSGLVDKKRFIRVKYGIEKLFVQQGRGLEIEKRAGRGNEIHIPLEITAALNNNGAAVVKGFEWCPLGIGIEIVAQPTIDNSTIVFPTIVSDDKTSQTEQRRSVKVKLTLKNCSENDIGIVDLPDYASFSVEASERSSKIWEFCHAAKMPEQITDEDVKILKPGEGMEFFFDFSEPRWFVNVNGIPQEIGIATSSNHWGTMLRIRYCPPPAEKCSKLKDSNLIWHGELLSRNFSPGGYID